MISLEGVPAVRRLRGYISEIIDIIYCFVDLTKRKRHNGRKGGHSREVEGVFGIDVTCSRSKHSGIRIHLEMWIPVDVIP